MPFNKVQFLLLSLLLSLTAGVVHAQTESEELLLKDVSGNELTEIIDSYQADKALMINAGATMCPASLDDFP